MAQPAGSSQKEMETVPGLSELEKREHGVVETDVEHLFEPRVKDWLKKLETGEEIQIPQVVSDNGKASVSVTSSASPVIQLPMTRSQIKKGLHRRVGDSVRWLAEWCVRMVKMYHGRVQYAPA